MGFEEALVMLKNGRMVKREGFRDTFYVRVQFPDQWSVNTTPYLQMVKGKTVFPLDLSCESIFANDWVEHMIYGGYN